MRASNDRPYSRHALLTQGRHSERAERRHSERAERRISLYEDRDPSASLRVTPGNGPSF